MALTPIHIPKDVYANEVFFQCLDCCRNQWRTIAEVTEEMRVRVPERAEYAAEHEVHRDRLDFATYMLLAEKDSDSRPVRYRLTQEGIRLVDAHLRHKDYATSKDILQRHLMKYTTANEKRARELHHGHIARPFLVALLLLSELERRNIVRAEADRGIPKRYLSDAVTSVPTQTDEELLRALGLLEQLLGQPDSRDAILLQFVQQYYGLTLQEYNNKVTNQAARLIEWLAKTELILTNVSEQPTWRWPSGLAQSADDVQTVYALTDEARSLLVELGYLDARPVRTREEQHLEHVHREESREHKLVKLLVKLFADEVIGQHLEPIAEEYVFPTGDKADLIMKDATGRLVAVEAEVDIVEEDDITGLLQAVKYKHMLEVERRFPWSRCRAMLVGFSVHPKIKEWASSYNVEVFEIPQEYRSMTDLVE